METWVALFRGINVGGHQVLPMKALATGLERAGFRAVGTYIQSGNVVFRSTVRTPAEIARRIGTLVSERHGFEPQVLVLRATDLIEAAARNPFHQADSEPQRVHLFFLAAPPPASRLESLRRLRTEKEAFRLAGRILYLYTPDGFGRSKLAAGIERLLGVAATARNWRTVSALLQMIDAEEST